MRKLSKRQMQQGILGTAVVLAVSAGTMGISAAAAPVPPKFTACLGSAGLLYNVVQSPTPARRCLRGDQQVTWNQIGPQGPIGPTAHDVLFAPQQSTPIGASRVLFSRNGLSIELICNSQGAHLGAGSPGLSTFVVADSTTTGHVDRLVDYAFTPFADAPVMNFDRSEFNLFGQGDQILDGSVFFVNTGQLCISEGSALVSP